VPAVLASILDGDIYLPAFRGRADLGEPEQVADFAARLWAERAGLTDISVTLGTSERLDPFTLRQTAQVGGETLAITLTAREFLRHGHCHDIGAPPDVVTRWLATKTEKL
jgi:hypothetical protein